MAKAKSDDKPAIGRPPMAPEDRRGKMLRVLTTDGERAELDRAAKASGLDTSSWVRAVALEKARRNEATLTAALEKARSKGAAPKRRK
jgi:uncharacterized protein (DUF1778 family)